MSWALNRSLTVAQTSFEGFGWHRTYVRYGRERPRQQGYASDRQITTDAPRTDDFESRIVREMGYELFRRSVGARHIIRSRVRRFVAGEGSGRCSFAYPGREDSDGYRRAGQIARVGSQSLR